MTCERQECSQGVKYRWLGNMSIWQMVSTGSLNFHPGPPCPTFFTPCGRATFETALWPFQGWSTQSLWPSSSPLDTPRRTGLAWQDPQTQSKFCPISETFRPTVDTVWTQCGHSVDTVWTQCGHSVDTVWTQCGHSVDTVWNSTERSLHTHI
jgi:hypothetical protein